MKNEIYETGCNLIAMECDWSIDTIRKAKNTIFALGADYKLLHLQQSDRVDGKFDCIGSYDFTGFDFSCLNPNSWNRCHFTPGTITFDEFVF